MQYELYIDVFVLVNFLMDYFILFLMKKILKYDISNFRLILASVVGAIISGVLVCVPIAEFVKLPILLVGVSAMMLKIAFNLCGKKLVREWCLFCFIGVLMGGVFLLVSQYTRYTILQICITYFVMAKAIKFLELYWKNITKKRKVSLRIGGKVLEINALYDTGNMLLDNITGKIVHIISAKGIKKFTNTPEVLRYIPYHTVQGETKVMPLIRGDEICIHGTKNYTIEKPYIGIAECEDFGSGEYELILHSECMQEDRNDDKNSC